MFGKKYRCLALFIALLILIFSVSVSSASAASAGVTIAKPHYSVQIGSTLKIKATGTNLTWT